jgi:hypothetical protein
MRASIAVGGKAQRLPPPRNARHGHNSIGVTAVRSDVGRRCAFPTYEITIPVKNPLTFMF